MLPLRLCLPGVPLQLPNNGAILLDNPARDVLLRQKQSGEARRRHYSALGLPESQAAGRPKTAAAGKERQD